MTEIHALEDRGPVDELDSDNPTEDIGDLRGARS